MMEHTTGNNSSASRKRLLVIDNDPGLLLVLAKGLALSGYDVFSAGAAEVFDEIPFVQGMDCILCEVQHNNAGASHGVVPALFGIEPCPPVVCTSAHPVPELVIECMKQGAADFIAKPFSLAEIRRVLFEVLKRLEAAPEPHERGQVQSVGESSLVGVSAEIMALRKFVLQIAKTDLNCLIRGESGTGKDVVAREIHRFSARHDKPFIKINCTALPESLLESELFGYEKGAFTGASASKPGRFSLANEGIIFLDEIGDMPPSLQAKILQVIEHKEFTPVGATSSKKVDVQIITATNADLERNVTKGLFRQDLYFRLNEISVWVPPLRERTEDIPFLVRHFLKKHNRYMSEDTLKFSGEELAAMSLHAWPGNIRELENAIKRWLVLGKNPSGGGLSFSMDAHAPNKAASDKTRPLPEPEVQSKKPPREVTPAEILDVLRQNKWNRKKAAEVLGMSYQTLRKRIQDHGLETETR